MTEKIFLGASDDSTRRTIIGMFPAGAEIVAFQPVEAALIADAERRLDAERAQAEAQARATVRVARAWLLDVLRDLILSVESHRKVAERRGDHARARALLREAWERRAAYDALAKDDPSA